MRKDENILESKIDIKENVNNTIIEYIKNYDIDNNKKYVIILIRSEIDDSNGGKDLLVDTVTYEI